MESIARQGVWWEQPEITLADQNEFLCRVMSRGLWEHVQEVERVYGEAAFREALMHCRPGIMDTASWHYWHRRLGIDPVPQQPMRTSG